MKNRYSRNLLTPDSAWAWVWLAPAAVLYLFLRFAVPALAENLSAAENELARLTENTYEKPWLDSTESRLRDDVARLQEFAASRKKSLPTEASTQYVVDRLRTLAEESGMEVLRTLPALGKAGELQRIQVRLEGLADYPQIHSLLSRMHGEFPDLYVEELSLRTTERRLETSLHVFSHADKESVP